MSKKKRSTTRRPAAARPAETAEPAPPATEGNPGKRKIILTTVAPVSIAVFYICMLTLSWLRWMDPLVDFPRDLYYAWRLSEGDLLYERLANWYGPLAQLVQGACFWIFGVGIDTMVWSNIGLTAVVVAMFYDLFRTMGDRWSAWLATMIFIGVFALGHYTPLGNYNFIAPYVAQSTYSFAGLVVLLWGLQRYLTSPRPCWLRVTGLGLAIAYLDKPEALLAAMGALAIFFAAQIVFAARARVDATDWKAGWQWAAAALGRMAQGFFALWLPVFLYLLCRGGLSYAVLGADFVPYSVLNSRFRSTLMSAQVQQGFFGFDHVWHNFWHQMYTGGVLVILFGVMIWAARAWARAPKGSFRWVALPVVAVAVDVVATVLAWQGRQWEDIGSSFVFPVVSCAALATGWSLRSAWLRRADYLRVLGNAIVGVAAALMMARMILNGRIYHFGFFMMPLAVMWVVHLMAVEAVNLPVAGTRRRNGLLLGVFSGLALVGLAVLTSVNLYAYGLKNLDVGTGRDHFYGFDNNVSSNANVLNMMLLAYKDKSPHAKTLTVFPEGIAVNYHLRVPTSMRELEFQPTAIAYAGPEHVLADLQEHPPEAVILFTRDMTEFGVKYFGADEGSGRNIVKWLNERYWLVGAAGDVDNSITGHNLDLLVPKTPGSKGVELLRDSKDALKTGEP